METIDPRPLAEANLTANADVVAVPAIAAAADTSQAKPTAHAGLGGRAAAGFVAAISSALLCRVAGLFGQIFLAWYLTKNDFGIAAVAVSASILVTLLREIGIIAMLSRHPKAYGRWATDAFWFSVLLAALGMVCLLIATPIIARQTHMPGIVVPTLLLGASWLFGTPANIPLTALSIQLRFRAVAMITTVLTLFTTCLGIVLAYFHAGPYAIVIPLAMISVLRLIVGLVVAPMPLWKRPQFSRWLVMLAYGWPLFISTVCVTIAMQGDNLILSYFQDETTLGVYYFAYQIVVQLLTLVGQNVSSVLLPAFGQIRDDITRQRQALVRAGALLLAIGLPPFFLQAALAEPLLRLVWRDKWIDAALPLTILSIGTGFRLLGMVATPYVWSRARLREYLIFTVSSAIAFIIIVTVGAQMGTTAGVSVAVTVYYALSETGFMAMAMVDRGHGFGRRRALADLAKVLILPVGIGIAVFATAWPLGYRLQHVIDGRLGSFVAVFVGGCWGMALQALLMCMFGRQIVRETFGRILSVVPALGRWPALRKLAGLSMSPVAASV